MRVVMMLVEFDECATDTHGCHHRCVNTLGGFKCECDIGYELHSDGKKCEGGPRNSLLFILIQITPATYGFENAHRLFHNFSAKVFYYAN